ncbi:MAG TPA: helix-turn-helix domain-containing protein [Marmoricola sp.]|nr:helix-turn-helix domain-containing protein [Marmoricola sp.]
MAGEGRDRLLDRRPRGDRDRVARHHVVHQHRPHPPHEEDARAGLSATGAKVIGHEAGLSTGRTRACGGAVRRASRPASPRGASSGGPRTAAAAQLLTTTDLTVEAIANRCGFGAPETLRQAFRAQYGVSPTHYRATQSGSGLAHAR